MVWFLAAFLLSSGPVSHFINPSAVSYPTQAACLAAAKNPPAGLFKVWDDSVLPSPSIGGKIGLACAPGYTVTVSP